MTSDVDVSAQSAAELARRFPDENPNPVLRIAPDGTVLYANPASQPILAALAVGPGGRLPDDLTARVLSAADDRTSLELPCDHQTYAIFPVPVPELGFLHLYGTDITARKVVDLFPDRNPYPVMRMTHDGVLTYANRASSALMERLELRVGEPLPADLFADLRAAFEAGEGDPVELEGGGRIYALHCVPVPELGFTNLYAADVTAQRAMTKFPDQNPHPVLRFDDDGRLLYANPASATVRKALGVERGDLLAERHRQELDRIASDGDGGTYVVEAEGRTFSLLAVGVYEFGFTNVYATDITANLEVERAHAENERLLLNILPPSIAERLRGGELVIADRVEEMTVLFADIVAFSRLSMSLQPTELIELLNRVFQAFDDLSERYELEKIKTIGDAYMVVGGLAPQPDNHCGRVADIGLDMLAATERLRREHGIDLHIRVGMHMGPAVAGVVGIKKFMYDVWGETVNTASRMESHGTPDRIQVTEAAYRRLRDRYDFEERGEIEVRGRGPMRTWYLTGRR